MAIRTENHDDLSAFKNRLWALMSVNGYDTPRKLATVLYDANLVSVKSKPNEYTTNEEIRKNAIGSVEKKITKHLHETTMTSVQGEYIEAYCTHFQCSADYLFGYTETQTNDPNIRNACTITGLSEKAIRQLYETLDAETFAASDYHKFWSNLLESDLFLYMPTDWLSAHHEAEEYLKCAAIIKAVSDTLKGIDPSSVSYNTIAIQEKSAEKKKQQHYDSYYWRLYKLTQSITSMVDNLIEQQTKEDRVYEKKLKQMKQRYQYILSSDNITKENVLKE